MIKDIKNTPLEGVLIIQNEVFLDNRGGFLQNYQEDDYIKNGINHKFIQDNISLSDYNVIRGLHYQLKNPQVKLVSVLQGSIFDVVVDIRVDSPTFGKYFGVYLDEFDGCSLLIPEGYAHGFRALDDCGYNIVLYKTSANFDINDQYSVNYSDDDIGINWGHISKYTSDFIISEKDMKAPYLKDIHIGNLPAYNDSL